jgi:hypothetical protein
MTLELGLAAAFRYRVTGAAVAGALEAGATRSAQGGAGLGLSRRSSDGPP